MKISAMKQGQPTSQRPRATFLYSVTTKSTLYTWAHMNITYLFLIHTHLWSATFIVNTSRM